MAYYVPPSEKVGGHVPHQISPMLMRQNEIHGFTWADQDWTGLMIFNNYADKDWIGFNICGSGLDSDWKNSQSAHLCCSRKLQYCTDMEILQWD